MPYNDSDQQIEYLRLWYINNKKTHLKNVSKYYYKNKKHILQQRKKRYISSH